jgi:mRNA interferase HigB
MHVISTSKLKEFYEKYPDAKPALLGWIKHTELAQWQSLAEVRQTSNNATDQVGKLTVFNIKGNHYRLITYIDYQTKTIFIRNFMTHSKYNLNKWKNDSWFK